MPHLAALQKDLAGFGGQNSGQNLEQGRFARAVVADEPEHLVPTEGERSIGKGSHGAKMAGDAARLEDCCHL